MDLADSRRQTFREAFTKPFEYSMDAGTHSTFGEEDLCVGCREPMVNQKPYVTVRGGDMFDGVLTYHRDCFICSCRGCNHRFPDPDDEGPTFSSSEDEDADDRKGDDGGYGAIVYLDDDYMPHCPRPQHIPNTSKFLTVPRFHAITHQCLNPGQVPDEWQDCHEVYTQFGCVVLVPPFEVTEEGAIPEPVEYMRTVIKTNIEFTSMKGPLDFSEGEVITDFFKGHEMRDVAKWPHKDDGFIGPYYKAKDDIDNYDNEAIRIGEEGKNGKTEAEVAEGALIDYVTQHEAYWKLRQKAAYERWFQGILVPKEHVSAGPDEVSQDPGGETNIVMSVGPAFVIPANPDGTNKLKSAGKIRQTRFDMKRFGGSGNRSTIREEDGSVKSVKKKPRTYEVTAFMALTDATKEKKGGMSVVLAPHRIKVKEPVVKSVKAWFTQEEIDAVKADAEENAEEDTKSQYMMRAFMQLKWKGEGKRPTANVKRKTEEAPEGHKEGGGAWVTLKKKVVNEQPYDWETFYLEARPEDRSPAYGIHSNSPFESMKQFIPLRIGDVLVIQRSGMFAFEEGTRTQMYAYLGAGTMDTRKITKQTRILCALNEFTLTTYNTHLYVHPAGLDGLGAYGCTWPGSEQGEPAPENLSRPIGVSELNQYLDALCGTRAKTQKLPSYYAQFQPKKARGRGTGRKFDQNSSVEVVKVPKPSTSKGKKPKGKMSDEEKKPQCPVSDDVEEDIVDRLNMWVTGGNRKSSKSKKGGSTSFGDNENFLDLEDKYDGFKAVRFYVNGPDDDDVWVDFVIPSDATEQVSKVMEAVDHLKPDAPIVLKQMNKEMPEPRLTTVIGGQMLKTYKVQYDAVPEDEHTTAVMDFATAVASALSKGSGVEITVDQILATYYRDDNDWNRARQENISIDPDQQCVINFVKGGAGRIIRFRWGNKGIELDLTIPETLASTGFFYIMSPACQQKGKGVGVFHEVPRASKACKAYMDALGDEYEALRLVQMHKSIDPSQRGKKSKKRKSSKATSKPKTKKMTSTESKRPKKDQKSSTRITKVKGSKTQKAQGYQTMLNGLIQEVGFPALRTSKAAKKGTDERHLYNCFNAAKKALDKFAGGKVKEEKLLEELIAFNEAIPREEEEEEESSSEEEIALAGGSMEVEEEDEDEDSSSSEKPAPKKTKIVPKRKAGEKAAQVIKKKNPDAKITSKLSKKTAKKVIHNIELAEELAGDGEFEPKSVAEDDEDEPEEEESSSSEEEELDEDDEEGDESSSSEEEENMMEEVEGDGSSAGDEDEEEEQEGDMNIKVSKKADAGVSDKRAKREAAFAKLEKLLDKVEKSYPVAVSSDMTSGDRNKVLEAQRECEENACGVSHLKKFSAAIDEYKKALDSATKKIKQQKVDEEKRMAEKKRKTEANPKVAKKKATPAKSEPAESPKKTAKKKLFKKGEIHPKAAADEPAPAEEPAAKKKKVTPKAAAPAEKTKTPTKKVVKKKAAPKAEAPAEEAKASTKRPREEEQPAAAATKDKKETKKKVTPKPKKVKEAETKDEDSAAAELELAQARMARMMKEMPAFIAMKTQFSTLSEQVPDLAELSEEDLTMFRGARQHLSGLLTEENFQKHGVKIPGAEKALQEFENLVKKLNKKKRKREEVEKEPEPQAAEEDESPKPMEVEEEDHISNYKVDKEEDDEPAPPNKKKTKTKEPEDEEEEEDEESSSEEHEPGSGVYLVFDDQNYLVAYLSENKQECYAWLSEQGFDSDDYYVFWNANNEYKVGDTVVVN